MKLINRLTGNYKRGPTSNIGKLLSVVDLEVKELKDAIAAVETARKIDDATGATLDNIGKNVLQERGSADDVLYRKLLKVKIRANRSNGEIDTLNDVLDVLLEDHYLGIREVWNDASYGNEPAAMEARYVNFFGKIRNEYQNLEDDPWYLDGKYKLDGTRKLDGGLTFRYSDYEQKILEAMTFTKNMVNYVKTGGVKVWWCEPLEVTNPIGVAHSTQMVIKSAVANSIESVLSTANAIKSEVTNTPDFILDGTVVLDGSLILNGQRPLIIYSTSVNIVTV